MGLPANSMSTVSLHASRVFSSKMVHNILLFIGEKGAASIIFCVDNLKRQIVHKDQLQYLRPTVRHLAGTADVSLYVQV